MKFEDLAIPKDKLRTYMEAMMEVTMKQTCAVLPDEAQLTLIVRMPNPESESGTEMMELVISNDASPEALHKLFADSVKGIRTSIDEAKESGAPRVRVDV